jgi:hypothetical protein
MPDWFRHVLKQLPAVLFLASLILLVHEYGMRLGLEPLVMQGVYEVQERGPQWMGLQYEVRHLDAVDKAQTITLVKLTPQSYAADFGGRSPLNRACLAVLLNKVAEQLPSMRASGMPIIAIDMDITIDLGEDMETAAPPMARPAHCADSDPVVQRKALKAVLDRLKKEAIVIALALERQTPGERIGRNRFVAQTCTPLADIEVGKGGVFYASAAVFSQGTEPVYDFPTRRHEKTLLGPQPRPAVGGYELPKTFPSLGNLLALARRLQEGTSPSPQEDKQSLASLCTASAKQSRDVGSDVVALPDDAVFGVLGEHAHDAVVDAYRFEMLNFVQLDLRRRSLTLDRVAALAGHEIESPSVVLSLEDGSSADRFVTPRDSSNFMPGAMLHIAAGVSLDSPMEHATHLLKWLADLAIGVVLCALVAPFHSAFHKRNEDYPLLQRSGALMWPPLAAAVVVAGATWIAALVLPHGLWLNPLFMAVGMLLHSYFDAARPPPRHPLTKPRPEPVSSFDRAVTVISDWVDVEAPSAKRSWLDRAWLGLWLLTVFLVVVWSLFLIVEELVHGSGH